MKKIILSLIFSLILLPANAKVDKTSAEYLKNKKHFAIMNPIAENLVEKTLRKALTDNIGDYKYNVKFEMYSLSSLKKGIFKRAEASAHDLVIDNIPIKYLKVKTTEDYVWLDLKNKPVKFKSDCIFGYDIELTEESINTALQQENYKKKITKVNNLAYPLFSMIDVKTVVKNNKLYFIINYNLPLSSNSDKVRTFVVASDFKVENGKILVKDIKINKSYKNLSLHKIANLLNLLDPLTFTLAELNDNKCKTKIENVTINDNIVKINGKIFVKGE